MVAQILFEDFADFDPGFGEFIADVGKIRDVVFDVAEDFGEAAIGGEVGGEGFFEVGKFASELPFVDAEGDVLFFVFDNQEGAIVTEEFDDIEPVVKVGIFFAGIGNQDIQRAFSQEKLVCLMINLLSTKVPNVDAKFFAVV